MALINERFKNVLKSKKGRRAALFDFSLHNYFFVDEASAEDVPVVFKPICFFPAFTFAEAVDELLDEAPIFFDEADTLLLPLMLALPDPLTLVLVANFFVLFIAAVVAAVAFAFLALSAALADDIFFAVADNVLLAAAFALLALAFNVAAPFAAPEPVKLALLLVASAAPFETKEPLIMVLPLPALTLAEDEPLALPSFLLSVKLNASVVDPVAVTEPAWLCPACTAVWAVLPTWPLTLAAWPVALCTAAWVWPATLVAIFVVAWLITF
jgi:hypothetical protein